MLKAALHPYLKYFKSILLRFSGKHPITELEIFMPPVTDGTGVYKHNRPIAVGQTDKGRRA